MCAIHKGTLNFGPSIEIALLLNEVQQLMREVSVEVNILKCKRSGDGNFGKAKVEEKYSRNYVLTLFPSIEFKCNTLLFSLREHYRLRACGTIVATYEQLNSACSY